MNKHKQTLSLLEKNFQTQETFKRNTRYYDAPELSNRQTQYEIRRRMPIQIEDNFNTKEKISSSFTHSTTILGEKLTNDIQKFKYRIQIPDNVQNDSPQKRSDSPTSPKVTSFSIGKMTSRSYIHKRTNKPEQDERMFNNFKIEKHDLSKTCNFGKFKPRSGSFVLQHINDLYHEDHQKIYQEYYYKRSTTNCKFNYKLENKDRKRFFFKSRRPENDPSTVLNPEKVDSGLKIATNFKGSNIKKDELDPFYKGSGRDLPSQYDNRFMNELTNSYKDKNGRIKVAELDFTIGKLKDEMQTMRKMKIKQSKRPTFGRNQICDERYFKMNIV